MKVKCTSPSTGHDEIEMKLGVLTCKSCGAVWTARGWAVKS